MNAQKFTQKSWEALQAAQSIAIQYQNQQREQAHLAYALADQEGGRKMCIRDRRYARFMQKRGGRWYPTAKRTGLHGEAKKYLSNCGQADGEWAEPEDVHHMTWKDCAVPHPEVATAYTAPVMECMAEIEAALGLSLIHI